MRFFLFIFFCFLSRSLQADEICSGIVVEGKTLKLEPTEKRMLCGDSESVGYKVIPPYEAQLFFAGFLQSRGFLNPHFEIKDDVLYVKTGKKSYVRKVTAISDSPKETSVIKKSMTHLYKRRLLTPATLDKMEGEALHLLRNRGFPCAKTKSEADSTKSLVNMNLERLDWFRFGAVKREQIKGLELNALDRFYPFEADDPFKGDLLKLTEKRMLRTEVVQGTYFLENCSQDRKSFSLEQRFIVGPPKTIRFGAGASTELGPMARVKWSNNRYKPMASQLSANLQASFRSQSLTLMADNYLWNSHPRRSLYSTVEFLRESQFDYEQVLVRARPHMKWTNDGWGHNQLYTLGPSYEAGTYNSIEGVDTKSFSTGYLEGSFQFTSHTYELFDIFPEDGDLLGFNFDLRHPALGFSDPMLKLDATAVKLARLTNSGRGTIVGGIRANLGTTWVSDDVDLKSLPPTVKFFGGGSDDIRGFLLKTLPRNDGLGALTRASLKFELRRTALFIEGLEGFVFLDNAYFGDDSFSTLPRLWYSPGIGLRWLSPIGLVQAYGARALATNPGDDLGNYFYAGFGGAF